MHARTILVLGGGGSLGAYQAGAVLALAEAGVLPDAMYGCSVGALNAAFLAVDPSSARAARLAAFWSDGRTHGVLSPSWRSRVVGLAAAAVGGGRALFDERPLRRLIALGVGTHDVSELAVPLSVTTTCLDCAAPAHHATGGLENLLVASCALPGLFPAVPLADGHRHVDGGVLCGVPVAPAVAAAGPDDRVLVLDCALAPVTSRPEQCGLGAGRPYTPPVEGHRGALEVMLSSFAVARAVANRANVEGALHDPRVRVLPHVGDAYAAGLLDELPLGPRDCTMSERLLAAGAAATRAWLGTGALHGERGDRDRDLAQP